MNASEELGLLYKFINENFEKYLKSDMDATTKKTMKIYKIIIEEET